ncbi:MAG: AAA family ATPase [Elusimicrobiota bacterium]
MRTNASPMSIADYLMNFAPAKPERIRRPMPFVTISREAGAGAHSLADALSARFAREKDPLFSQWQVFDRGLCERVAEDATMRTSLDGLLNDEFHSGFEDYLRQVLAGASSQSRVHHALFKTVREVCTLGKAIVIGRASAFVSRDLTLGVHVRLIASRKARIERVRRETGLGALETGRALDLKDAQRARLVKTYFQKDVADAHLYDAVWNSDYVSFDAMSAALVALIRERTARRTFG